MQRFFRRRPPAADARHTRVVRLFLAVAATTLWSVGMAGPVSAQYVTPEPPLTGASTDVQVSPVDDVMSATGGGATGQRAAQAQSGGQGLPITGGDVVGLTAIGVGAIAAGALVLHVRRRATRS